jgi:hypothetical protein
MQALHTTAPTNAATHSQHTTLYYRRLKNEFAIHPAKRLKMYNEIRMQAKLAGHPTYSLCFHACDAQLQRYMQTDYLTAFMVEKFIKPLRRSPEFNWCRITFELVTHGGAQVHRLVTYLDEEGVEDLKKFWVPIVTKYILEK